MSDKNLIQARLEVQKKVVDAFDDSGYNGFAIVPTGTGKAWILIEILKRIKPKTCWYLVDSTDNRDKSFKKEMIKWGAGELINSVEFMCYQTAYKKKGFKVELLLGDEADFSLTPKYSKVYANNTFKHKVLVSGTLTPDKKQVLDKIAPVIFDLKLKQAEDKKVLNKTNYYFVNYLLNNTENKQYIGYNRRFAKLLSEKFPDQNELQELQIQRKHFLSNLDSSVNVCRRLLKELYDDEDKKILVFCGLSKQADAVCKYSYHSKSETQYLDAFDSGDIRVLSVVSKIDRGVNIKGVNVIVLESPSKSSTKFLQRTGRGRRLDVDDVLSVYFLIPYYKTFSGTVKATAVLDWVYKSTAGIKLNAKTFKFKK